jgi:hypothetical protein
LLTVYEFMVGWQVEAKKTRKKEDEKERKTSQRGC